MTKADRWPLWYCCSCNTVVFAPWTRPMERTGDESYRGTCAACNEDHDFFPVRDVERPEAERRWPS